MIHFLRKHRLRRAQHKATSEHIEQAERLVTVLHPASTASEAYRTLRTNLLYALVDSPPKVIVLTSPSPGEGKSTVCCNLGVVLAQAGKRTLIVDCDFRKPKVHRFFGVLNVYGMGDILAGERIPQEVWTEPIDRLNVISVGPIPPNPTERLGSQRFSKFLASMRQEFDHVLVDAAPLGLVSDAAILANQGDGILLIIDAQHTRKSSVRQARRSLETVGATILGQVMNNVQSQKGGYYYGSYGYR